jgi:hypothetical protein
MKKILFTFSLIGGLLLMNSCGEKAKEEKSDKEEKTEESTEESTEENMEETTEVSCEQPMMDFMAMLKGSYTDVESALDKYGAEGLDRVDMDMYDLKEPKVVSCQKADAGECCTMEAGAGMTIRTYDICWTDGKITSIVDKGMR